MPNLPPTPDDTQGEPLSLPDLLDHDLADLYLPDYGLTGFDLTGFDLTGFGLADFDPPDDGQGLPREGAPAMNRWLEQPPSEEAVLTSNLRETQGIPTEDPPLEWQAGDGDTSRIPPSHHQNTQEDRGQSSSNAHDTIQLEDSSAHQHQDRLPRLQQVIGTVDVLITFANASADIGNPTPDSPEAQNRSTEGPVNTNIGESDEQTYECPFYRQNPSDYGEGNWENCAKKRWKSYQRVREHITRRHKRPAALCEKCFEVFEDDDSLREHFESQCERRLHSPYMSTNLQERLGRRLKGGMEEAEKMEQMYQIFSNDRASLSRERSSQIRFEMSLRSLIAASLIPLGDIERIMNDVLQAIQRASSTDRIELEHNRQGCDGIENALAVSSGITEHAPMDIEHNVDNRLLRPRN